MYKYLFRNYFKYFYNLRIILLGLYNFKDEIINFFKNKKYKNIACST